jgi:hypothetical protein
MRALAQRLLSYQLLLPLSIKANKPPETTNVGQATCSPHFKNQNHSLKFFKKS